MTEKRSAEKTVRDIRRRTRKKYSAEEKIGIVLEGLRGEESIAELCRREGLNSNVYYRWSKEFMEAGKKRLAGDTVREACSDEVKELRAEAAALKETLGEVVMENRLLRTLIYPSGRRWFDWISTNPPFTTGSNVIRNTALMDWKTKSQRLSRYGIGSVKNTVMLLLI